MDYVIDQPNNQNDGLSSSTIVTNTTSHSGRKRHRSNSMNASGHPQKSIRLLSPPRQRPPQSMSGPISSTCVINENLLVRQSSVSTLTFKTQAMSMLDNREPEMMEYDNESPSISQNHGIEMAKPESALMSLLQSDPMRSQRMHRQTHLPYTMGYRADCDKCCRSVPGHYAHVLPK